MNSWPCAGCGERNPGRFVVCWNCGCAMDGEPDALFRLAEEIDPRKLPTVDTGRTWRPNPPARFQLSLRSAFILLTVGGCLSFILRLPHGLESMAALLVFILLWGLSTLGLIGGTYVVFQAVGWLVAVYSEQNEIADDPADSDPAEGPQA